MIVSYRHKGLELYATKGDRSKPQMMTQPGYNFHSLSGDLKGFYAVKVNSNWRIIFRFEGENAYDVDYKDYH